MNKVKEVLEVLGLEVGVEYKCVGFRGIYKINNSGALLINLGKGFDYSYRYGENIDLIDVISGKIVLTPMPFKPKDKDRILAMFEKMRNGEYGNE